MLLGPRLALWSSLALVCACSGRPTAAHPTAEEADASTSSLSSPAAILAIVATCASANGDVQVRRAGKPYWEPVNTGTAFRAGDWVRTAKASFARVELLAGGSLELGPEAVVAVDKAAIPVGKTKKDAPEVVVAVESGEVKGFAPTPLPDEPAPGVHIRTADGSNVALVAKEGEEPVQFRVTRGVGATELAVMRGVATIKDRVGERELKAGQAADLAGGKAGPVVDLPDFPQLTEPGIDARFQAKPNQVIHLAWKPVTGVASYHLDLARDFSFQAIAVSADTPEAEYSFRPEREGVYVWRVAARDDNRRQGEFGFARRFYIEHEQPNDLLLGPEDGAVFSSFDAKPKITFTWRSAGDTQAYRLVVAHSPDLLRNPVVTVMAQNQRVDVKNLAPGDYFWGAYAEGDVPEPIFLKARKLAVKKTDKSKLKTPKAINRWGD